MNDSLIEQWVLKHLALIRMANCREVCVLSRAGIVTLDGTVPDRTAKLAMQKAALTVNGVIAVVNNLQWEPAGTAMAGYSSVAVSRSVRPGRARRALPGRAISVY